MLKLKAADSSQIVPPYQTVWHCITEHSSLNIYRVLRTSGICLSIVAVLCCQIEKSPTLGSIESSEYEKRQLAGLSLDFNLQDKVFCELFPDMVTVSLL